MQNIKSFFTTWSVILILNQIFIFHGCFSPHCLLAAFPHTGIIAFLINKFVLQDDENTQNKTTSTLTKDADFESELFTKEKQTIPKSFPKNRDSPRNESSFLEKYRKNPKNSNTILNSREFASSKKMSYKDLPIVDQTKYEGSIKNRYDNNLILLQIKNVGMYKIKLPARKKWNSLNINESFMFYREKYKGTGKNRDIQYAKLIIV